MRNRKVLILVLVILTVFFVGEVGYSWYQLQRHLGHHFASDVNRFPKPAMPYKEISFNTLDGVRIVSWYIPIKNPKAVVILVHGYDPPGAKAQMLPHADYLYRAGYTTLLVDMRGNGESEGSKVTLGVSEWQDLEAAYDYAKSLPENKDIKVGFLAESVGAVASIITISKTGKGDFIIADVPFANYKKFFAAAAKKQERGWIPGISFFIPTTANFFLGFGYEKYSPDKLIKNINAPIFIAWSVNDVDIGPNQGSELYKLANSPKEQWEADLGHEITYKNIDAFGDRVLTFLSKYVSQ